MPQFPGGQEQLVDYLSSRIKYPPKAQRKGITGRVFVNFIVDTDGSICNVTVLKGVHPLLDKEAQRVVINMPKWEPGYEEDKLVKVS